jgi:hypothetical protein
MPIQSVSTGHYWVCHRLAYLCLILIQERALASWSVSALCGCLNFGGDLIHLCCAAVDDLLQGEVDIVLESPDQKTRGFLVQIALSQ